MRWWENIFLRHRSAQDSNAPRQEDETLPELKALFEAAREEAPPPDNTLWEKLRPQLAAHEAQVQNTFSFVSTLAATGPRFAVAAVGVLLLVASLLGGEGAERQVRTRGAIADQVAYLDRNPLNPIMMIGSELEAQTGEDLLQFVAYGSPDR